MDHAAKKAAKSRIARICAEAIQANFKIPNATVDVRHQDGTVEGLIVVRDNPGGGPTLFEFKIKETY